MNKSVKKFFVLCCITAVLVVWDEIYASLFFTEDCQTKWSLIKRLILIPLGIREELIFRYLPILISTCIYLGFKKIGARWGKISLIPLGILILVVQFVFAIVHLPLDPLDREALYDLPPYPTLAEIIEAFFYHGIAGIVFCICYLIYIPKEKPLSLLQVKSLIASSFAHIVCNQLIV
jgi:hypothetical protein